MKRIGNLYPQIYSLDNLVLADQKARKGKAHQYGVQLHDRNRDANILKLHEILKNKTYCTSPYKTFTIYEPKERVIFSLPYFPDRITHHAIMNVLKPIFVSRYTTDTYSCIEGRGIHAASYALRHALRDIPGTQYRLKLDVKKFYPSIDHEILKAQLSRVFKDPDLLWLLREIIDSALGLPIGNLLSQYFSNFYLTPLDRFIKQQLHVTDYFRYMDDIVIPASNKPYLHAIFAEIRNYLKVHLNLEVKGNYSIAPVDLCGIDFVGYKHYHTHTLIRKSIKKDFSRMMYYGPTRASIASYMGWASHADSIHFLKKLKLVI
jgi:RNA-directed DNA polymerase